MASRLLEKPARLSFFEVELPLRQDSRESFQIAEREGYLFSQTSARESQSFIT